MQQLSELIARREDWLVNRTIHYAKLHGYTPFTSTLTEAWRTAICGMSAPLIAALAEYSEPPQLTAAADYADDSITAFGIQVARRHRSRGITLGLFLGLMKYYRQSYLDLLDLGELPEADLPRYREFINRFYDRVEIGFCSEWASQNESALVHDVADEIDAHEQACPLAAVAPMVAPPAVLGLTRDVTLVVLAAIERGTAKTLTAALAARGVIAETILVFAQLQKLQREGLVEAVSGVNSSATPVKCFPASCRESVIFPLSGSWITSLLPRTL